MTKVNSNKSQEWQKLTVTKVKSQEWQKLKGTKNQIKLNKNWGNGSLNCLLHISPQLKCTIGI